MSDIRSWGAHYLRSLSRAHLAQVCNNFKAQHDATMMGVTWNIIESHGLTLSSIHETAGYNLWYNMKIHETSHGYTFGHIMLYPAVSSWWFGNFCARILGSSTMVATCFTRQKREMMGWGYPEFLAMFKLSIGIWRNQILRPKLNCTNPLENAYPSFWTASLTVRFGSKCWVCGIWVIPTGRGWINNHMVLYRALGKIAPFLLWRCVFFWLHISTPSQNCLFYPSIDWFKVKSTGIHVFFLWNIGVPFSIFQKKHPMFYPQWGPGRRRRDLFKAATPESSDAKQCWRLRCPKSNGYVWWWKLRLSLDSTHFDGDRYSNILKIRYDYNIFDEIIVLAPGSTGILLIPVIVQYWNHH